MNLEALRGVPRSPAWTRGGSNFAACAQAGYEAVRAFEDAIGEPWSPAWLHASSRDCARVNHVVERVLQGFTPEDDHDASHPAQTWAQLPALVQIKSNVMMLAICSVAIGLLDHDRTVRA